MRRNPGAAERRARKAMKWPHATVGVQASIKAAGNVKKANDIYGPGRGGIEDAMLPAWKRKKLKI